MLNPPYNPFCIAWHIALAERGGGSGGDDDDKNRKGSTLMAVIKVRKLHRCFGGCYVGRRGAVKCGICAAGGGG